ncbi:hypothetical protein [Nonomuraea sp. NPDC049725]|uniref:hypothetical protein n=1 Tax=Nonomuraea sp. NPDC049725 TaxID=3154508 RepID=UPI0034275D5B
MVLFAALLAPAIFAGGLLAGEMSQYQHEGKRGREREFKVFAPVLVPPPAHPARQYVAAMPAPVTEVETEAGVEVVDVPGEPAVQTVGVTRDTPAPPVQEVAPEPSDRAPAATSDSQSDCPGEWVDTWLWELCREHERQPAVSLTGDLASGL